MSRAIMTAGAAAAVLALTCTPAISADNGVYIGGSVGQGSIETDFGGAVELDGDDTGFKLIAGIRPLDFLGFELNYVDLGTVDDTVGGVDIAADSKGIDAFAVGFLGLPFMDLFAKAGMISWDADLSSGLGSLSADGEDFAWGLGAQVRFGSAAVRAEYERFDISDLDEVNMISIGLTWTFL